jgi:hypothetical protein
MSQPGGGMNALLRSWARALGGDVSGDGVLCPGPGHGPQDRSLSVKIGKDGEPIVHSFAGDDWRTCRDYVRENLGLPEFKTNGGRKPAATYEFRDPATGDVCYRKERIECADDGTKSFFFKPAGRNGSGPLLYGGERLADIAASGQPVFIVEGEKKVDRLRELGAVAVSGDSGASSKWLPAHADLLRGLPIILWPDSDECLRNSAASLKVVRPFGAPNGAKGRDVCDWHGNADDLAALAAGAPLYAPIEGGPGNGQDGDDPALARVAARPFVWRDPKTIPPRQRLYGQHYIRKFVSATIAAPGIGKSSLDLVELIAMASGRPLLGVPVPKQLRVWYWNLEDPYDEIERRIAAVLLHFNIDPAEIEGRLFVNSGRDDPLVIAEMVKGAVAVHAPLSMLSPRKSSRAASMFYR